MIGTFSVVMLLAVAIAGGLGAVCRLLLDGATTLLRKRATTWGTVVVNLSGSFAVGAVAGGVALTSAAGELNIAGALMADSIPVGAALGFLGGYTTFSTASYQTVRLAQAGRWAASMSNGLLQLAGAAAMVAVGWGAVSLIIST